MTGFHTPFGDQDEFLSGTSAATARLESQIRKVAGTPQTTVLVLGDRGREPALVARSIHALSAPDEAPFLAVDCAALSAQYSETPPFAGADGLFQRAGNGTLFVNEVAELDPAAQSNLLDELDRRAATAAPAEGPRLIASTALDLDPEVEGGRFRSDLFYRLNVLTVRVPKLSDRLVDIPELAEAVLRSCRAISGLECTLSLGALEALRTHDWPGNLFELETVLSAAVLAVGPGVIGSDDLRLGRGDPETGTLVPTPKSVGSLRELEESMIRRVLSAEGGNRSRTARKLGINRTTLYNKLRQYGIA